MEAAIRFFQDGGAFMYVVLATLGLGVAITIERAYYIYIKCRLDVPAFMKQIEPPIREKDYDRARKICEKYPQPVAQVIHSGLSGNLKRADLIQYSMEEKLLEILPALQRRTPLLNMIAQITMLVGLLGTIHGLILAFRAVATAGAAEKASILASSISIALNCTAFGLVVAILCMAAASFLLSRTEAMVAEIEQNSRRVYNILIQDLPPER